MLPRIKATLDTVKNKVEQLEAGQMQKALTTMASIPTELKRIATTIQGLR